MIFNLLKLRNKLKRFHRLFSIFYVRLDCSQKVSLTITSKCLFQNHREISLIIRNFPIHFRLLILYQCVNHILDSLKALVDFPAVSQGVFLLLDSVQLLMAGEVDECNHRSFDSAFDFIDLLCDFKHNNGVRTAALFVE